MPKNSPPNLIDSQVVSATSKGKMMKKKTYNYLPILCRKYTKHERPTASSKALSRRLLEIWKSIKKLRRTSMRTSAPTNSIRNYHQFQQQSQPTLTATSSTLLLTNNNTKTNQNCKNIRKYRNTKSNSTLRNSFRWDTSRGSVESLQQELKQYH